MMTREVTVTENNFLSIFSDAVMLYEAAKGCEDLDLQCALAKSSVLSVNYALEAAANSFMESVDISASLKKQVDKFRTLEKFDFVLQYHSDEQLSYGEAWVQDVKSLIDNRNSFVHPKVKQNKIKIETVLEPGQPPRHQAIYPTPKKGADPKPKLLGADPELYSHKDAAEALVRMTRFLNQFIVKWGVTFRETELFLFQTWDGSLNGRPIMFREHQVRAIIRNDHFLNIEFMGLHGLVDTDQSHQG